MDKRQLQRFKKKLLAMREQLIARIQAAEGESLGTSRREASGDLSGYPIHMADAGCDNYLADADLVIAGNNIEALHELDEALMRIKEGTYGICRNCGQDISPKRLSAVPYTRTCYECASRAEKG